MQTSLVAGGAGFIGSHLCEYLLNSGHKVICVDNFLTSQEENIEGLKSNPDFSFINHDITKPLPEGLSADFVFHLASPASPNHHSPISYHKLAMETMMANTQGTLLLLEFAKKNNARFLFASTSEIYGDPLENPQREEYRGNTSTTGPRSVYDESKRFGETLTAYFNRNGLDTRTARIFNTYGPRIMPQDMRMLTVFITEALKGEPITVFGDGKQTRSLTYVSDAVEGLTKFMFTDNLGGEVVNIGSDEEYSVLEFAQLVKKLTGSSSEIKMSEPLPEDDPKERRPDIGKAKKLLNWEPKVGLEEGIRMTIDYYKNL
jgi:nucleoside-diphosphate-sugar epimerase